MKTTYLTPIVLAVAALVSACGSAPKSTSLLEQTRSDYRMAQSNPNVVNYAQLELKQASDALNEANKAADHNDSAEKIDKLAYLANRQIALTQEVAKQKSAEAEAIRTGRERDQVLLGQRTNEANQALASAAQSKQDAQIARDDTANAQAQTQEAQARAAQLEAQLADMAAKKTERGMVITLGDVLFGTDQARLTSDGMRSAQKLAQVLQQNPRRTVLVEGFTDSTGTTAHNQDLSDRRAGAVRSALLELGVARERVATRGYGEAYPMAANDTAQNRQLNRRVEIVLSDDTGKIVNR
ncbi:MAG: OmpA family protein [Pseudomonadota bacterium]